METQIMFNNTYVKTIDEVNFIRYEQQVFANPTGLVYEVDFHEYDEENDSYTEYLGILDLESLVRAVQEHGKESPDYELGFMCQSYYWLVKMPDGTFYPFPLLFESKEVREISAEEAGKPVPSDEDIQLVFTEILRSAVWP